MRASGALGEEVNLTVERGTRAFASGDRIMFLRNERSLGVRNGSLGTVQCVSPLRMAVMLDDGRAVAFDIKHYADIDHGYAATIHKAQGTTVTHVHVLATPGLDRHAAYVALSRHRGTVDLHYGEDDFADRGKLIRTLSRERGKDMASDYARKPQQAPEPQPRRNIFAGMKLSPAIERPQARLLDQAVERYTRSMQEIRHMRDKGYDPLPHQRQALAQAREALNALRPDAAHDLRAAFASNPALISEAAKGRTINAIRQMTAESEIRLAENQRADRFVADWQMKARQLRALERNGDHDASWRLRESMAGMAKSLQRDPQLESLLRNRKKDLGLTSQGSAPLSHDLQEHLSPSRSRGIGR